jgi:hypothetical protein
MNMVRSEASIVEASDIVTRVLAVGLDPSVLTVGDITTFPGVTVPY